MRCLAPLRGHIPTSARPPASLKDTSRIHERCKARRRWEFPMFAKTTGPAHPARTETRADDLDNGIRRHGRRWPMPLQRLDYLLAVKKFPPEMAQTLQTPHTALSCLPNRAQHRSMWTPALSFGLRHCPVQPDGLGGSVLSGRSHRIMLPGSRRCPIGRADRFQHLS